MRFFSRSVGWRSYSVSLCRVHVVLFSSPLRRLLCSYSPRSVFSLILINSHAHTDAMHTKHIQVGDDLRQDQLVLQAFSIMNELWRSDGLDLKLRPYGCIVMGEDVGLLEIVPNCQTVASIISDYSQGGKGVGKLSRAFSAAFRSESAVLKWLQAQHLLRRKKAAAGGEQKDGDGDGDGDDDWTNIIEAADAAKESGERNRAVAKKASIFGEEFEIESEFKIIQDNFARSCAGYCVATYVLGIGDRHPSNILLDKHGHLVHIDFGHFLGNFKTKFGFKRETAPFVFTRQFAMVLGGVDSALYDTFRTYCLDGFCILRKHARHLCSLLGMMLSFGIRELQDENDIQWVQEHLRLDLNEQEARAEFDALITESLACKNTQFNNFCHVFKHS